MPLECFGLSHCMLRNQRNNLVRDLWRLRPSESSANTDSGSTSPEYSVDLSAKSSLNSMLKRLNVEELESLLLSIKSKGREHNECVMAHKDLPQVSTEDKFNIQLTVNYVACQIWRWPDLTSSQMLKKIPSCHSGDDIDALVCINPFHWCRTIVVEHDLKNEDSLSLGDGSILKRQDHEYNTETETSGRDNDDKSYWCQVAYRELRERIGQLFPVYNRAVDIFQDIPQGSGLSLGVLHQNHHAQSEQVAKIRARIGTGLTLSDEGDQVWLYNRSSVTIFVSSYSLNGRSQSPYQWRVYKMNPGSAIAVYDYLHMKDQPPTTMGVDGPVDPHSIHISFVKGWGSGYSRQTILSCACWLEVLLHVDR